MGHLLANYQLLLNRSAALAGAVKSTSYWSTSTTKTWIVNNPRRQQTFREIHYNSMNSISKSHLRLLVTKNNRLQAPVIPSNLVAAANRYLSTSSARSNNSSGGDCNKREWKTISLSKPQQHVAHIELNRPKVKNAFGLESANELMELLDDLEDDPTIRCVLLSGNGPDFTSGVDLRSFMSVYGQLQETGDVGRRAKLLRSIIEKFQAPFKRMELFTKPLLCVQHGLCYGLGMELAACSDIRYCSSDTKYSIREVLIGIAADVGSLQKMPALVNNQSFLRELIYTGRDVSAGEALQLGFVNLVSPTKEEAIESALKTAMVIAKRSPVAVQGSKENLRFSSDKAFNVGLEYNAIWNMCMMQSGDVVKAIENIVAKSGEDADYENF